MSADEWKSLDQPLSLRDWVQELLDNCIRIAHEKTDPDDRARWLEDASYFRAILSAEASYRNAVATLERAEAAMKKEM